MSGIEEKLDSILNKLSVIDGELSEVKGKIKTIENTIDSNKDFEERVSAHFAPRQAIGPGHDPCPHGSRWIQFSSDSTGDIDFQGQYLSISKSVQSVDLPPECRLLENRTGIKKNELPTFHALVNSARYVETSLKLLRDENPDFDKLLSIQLAHIKYIQEEYASTVIKSQCNESVSKWFKTIAKNTSTFTPQVCDTIKTAAELSKATDFAHQGSGDRNYRGRGRGRGDRGSFRGNHQFREPYQNMFKGIPTQKPPPRFQQQQGYNDSQE